MDRDVCDRFPRDLPALPVDDDEPEVEEPCDGCESMQLDVRGGLCPMCRRNDELSQMALEEGSYAVRRRVEAERAAARRAREPFAVR